MVVALAVLVKLLLGVVVRVVLHGVERNVREVEGRDAVRIKTRRAKRCARAGGGGRGGGGRGS